MKFLPKKRKAFTLVELLVVIFIIGILFTIAAAAYFRAQIIARDDRRKADLAHIATALEQFYQDNGAYPTEGWVKEVDGATVYPRDSDIVTCGIDNKHEKVADGAILIFPFNPFACTTPDGQTKTYLNSMPGDPLNGSSYVYEVYDNFSPPIATPPDPQLPPDWCLGVGRVDRCQKYTLWAKLEGQPPLTRPLADPQCDLAFWADGSDVMAARGYNYCIHQP